MTTTPPDVAPIGDEALNQIRVTCQIADSGVVQLNADDVWALIARLRAAEAEVAALVHDNATLMDSVTAETEARVAAEARQQVPDGWRFVPAEPTKEMIDAHFEAHAKARTVFADVADIWHAMLAAAPPSPCAVQQQWRPISDAPRNGTPILTVRDTGCGHEHFVVWWIGPCDYPWASDGNDYVEDRFDEWMPLPPPPEGAA